ncbi:hypothetical protein ABZX65_08930 [Streptomyces sp. NPDC003300]|uniref:hypothetical protein n=1 Tax=unclassified Streptomyces TaxID=2593676 RepID=UPI0033AC60E8
MPIEPIEFEDELGDALRRTADTFQPDDSRGLVAEGHAHGRRLRRRRTAAITAGVAAFALVGVGGALVGGLAKGDGGSGVASAPTKPAVSSTASDKASSAAKPARPAMTAKQVMDLFLATLPKGHVTKSTWPSRGTEEGIPLAAVVFNKGLVTLGIGAGEAVPSCPDFPSQDPDTSCTSTHVHGGTLTISKGFEYSDHRAETKEWYATLVTPSGAVISLSEWNSRDEKDAPISRPNPPLSSAQLAKIVTDPRWQRVIDALPDPDKATRDNAATDPSAKDKASARLAGTYGG